MVVYFCICYFLYGILIGSFLNVCIYRIPLGKTVVTFPSSCMSCGTKIKPYDLIPIVSYFLIKGRCRSCGLKISPQYPIVEMLNGVLYILIYIQYGFTFISVIYCLFLSALIVLTFIDIKYQLVPPPVNFFILILAVAVVVSDYTHIVNHIIGFFIISVPLYIVALLYKGGMGGGDIKLFAVCGALLGIKLILVAFFITIVCASLFGIVLMCFNKKKNLKSALPLVPFITIGCFSAVLYGTELAAFYLGLMF